MQWHINNSQGSPTGWGAVALMDQFPEVQFELICNPVNSSEAGGLSEYEIWALTTPPNFVRWARFLVNIAPCCQAVVSEPENALKTFFFHFSPKHFVSPAFRSSSSWTSGLVADMTVPQQWNDTSGLSYTGWLQLINPSITMLADGINVSKDCLILGRSYHANV